MKGKKLLSGALSAVMVLGTASLPTFAEIDVVPEELSVVYSSYAPAVLSAATTVEPDYSWYDTTKKSFELTSLAQYLGFVKITQGSASGIVKDNFKGKTVTLKSDIDFAGMDFYACDTDGNETADWQVYDFCGTFDGNNKSIKNITIINNSTNSKSVGVFYSACAAELKNIKVSNINATSVSAFSFGGLVYRLSKGANKNVIDNCSVTDAKITINDTEAYNIRIGGLIGYAIDKTEVTNCKVSNFTVNANNRISRGLGGLIGQFFISDSENKIGKIENCNVDNFKANVKGLGGHGQSGSYNGGANGDFGGIGGMLGYGHSGNDTWPFDIKNCHVTNLDLTVGEGEDDSYVGGFVGMSRRRYNAVDCSVSGKISAGTVAKATRFYVGGFAGAPTGADTKFFSNTSTDPAVSYTNCTADVDIIATGEAKAGGFVGISGSSWGDNRIGYNESINVKYDNCKASGTIESATVAGGFAGVADRGTFEDCDVSDAIVNGAIAGGFIGNTRNVVNSNSEAKKVGIKDSKGSANVIGTTTDSLIGKNEINASNLDINHYTVGGSTVDLGAVKVKTAAGEVTYYDSFDLAYDAAQDGDTITLCQENTEIHSTIFGKDITIDAQNNKIKLIANNTVGGENINFHTSKNITFKNANITLEDRTTTTETALFNVGGDTTVTFDNVDFTVDGYTAGAVFYNGGTIDIKNDSDFVLKNCTDGANAFAADSSTAVLNITDSKVYCDSTKRAVINQTTTIVNSTFDVKNVALGFNSAPTTIKNGSNVTITGSSAHGFTNGSLNIENNSNMIVSGCTKYGVHLSTSENTIKNNSTLTVTNCGEAEIALKNDDVEITKDSSSKIIGTIERLETQVVANNVKVSYEEVVTENEDEKVYNIYVETDEKAIKRLTSAEFIFNLTVENGAIDYVISGDKMNVAPDSEVEGRYLFNFDGENRADITGKKICLGQIKFTGYGKFDFTITDGKVHATSYANNVVKSYVLNPVEVPGKEVQDGSLDYSAKLENIEIAVATRDLTIDVIFPNAVEDNKFAYQDMTVTIKGRGVNKEIKLGTDETAMVEGKYTITEELVKNMPYTVTISGAGYRTANYTVTMKEDKNLCFWNNVMTAKKAVEVGKDSSAKKATFLAGEIVKDGKINIYDLSAVISYFGAEATENEKENGWDFAKYDLNRDGKVDSKDVAYVLASFNN